MQFKHASQKRVVLEPSQRPFQSLMILGDIGIGKTRLAEEMVLYAHNTGWNVAWSRVYAQERAVSYCVWADLLRNAMNACVWPHKVLKEQPLLYQPLSILLPELHAFLPDIALPHRSREQEDAALWEAILAYLILLSKAAPLLLIIDDMQWIDERSIQLWTYLVRRMPGYPVAIVGTCREHEERALKPILIDLKHEHVGTSIFLRPLDQQQITQMLAHCSLSAAATMQVVSQAAGNPLFAEELARQVALQAIQDEQGPEEARREPIKRALPDTIDAALEMHMKRLRPECQRILAKAAVIGYSFELAVIVAMEQQGSHTEEDEILDALEEAIEAGILTEIAETPEHITYQFWHPLFASHMYERLAAARKASYHRLAARALELVAQSYGSHNLAAEAASIALHLYRGGGPATTLAHYAEMAADRAYTMLDCIEAERFYQLALEAHTSLKTNSGHIQLLWERLADVSRILCKGQEAKVAFEHAFALHMALSDKQHDAVEHANVQAMYLVELAHTCYNNAELEQADRLLVQAEDCLRAIGVYAGTVWGALYFIRSYLRWKQGEYTQAYISAQAALENFQATLSTTAPASLHSTQSHLRRTLAGDPADVGRAHRFLGALLSSSASSMQVSVQDALEHQMRAKALFEEYGCIREAGSILCDIGNVYLQQAEHSAADQYFQQCLQVTERIGDTGIQCVAWCNRGIVAHREKRFEEARAYFDRALHLAQTSQDPVYEIMIRALLVILLTDITDLDGATSQLKGVCALARGIRNRPCTGMAFVTLAYFHTHQAEMLKHEGQCSTRTGLLTRAISEVKYALSMHLDTDFHLEALFLSVKVQWLHGKMSALDDAQQLIQQCRQTGALWMQRQAERLLEKMEQTFHQHNTAHIAT